jgi:hypothetical protein
MVGQTPRSGYVGIILFDPIASILSPCRLITWLNDSSQSADALLLVVKPIIENFVKAVKAEPET